MIGHARVNGRVFLNVASMGVYAETVSGPAYSDAKIETARRTLVSHTESGATYDLRHTDRDAAVVTTRPTSSW